MTKAQIYLNNALKKKCLTRTTKQNTDYVLQQEKDISMINAWLIIQKKNLYRSLEKTKENKTKKRPKMYFALRLQPPDYPPHVWKGIKRNKQLQSVATWLAVTNLGEGSVPFVTS